MKSLTQYIYEKSSTDTVYIVFLRGKNGYNFEYIEDSDGKAASRYSDWSNRYLAYAIKCNDANQAMDKISKICKDTEKSWIGTDLSNLNDANDAFEKALTNEFGEKSFAKDLIKAMSRGELQDGIVDLYKSLNHDFS